MPLRWSRAAAVAVAGSLLLGACATAADRNPLGAPAASTSDDPTTTTAPGVVGFAPAPIRWTSCRLGECAKVTVPLDYSSPNGRTIELAVSRAPATGDRIGALFVNPGGPGATATDFAAILATILPEQIHERFDIVGIDPRGVGGSIPIDCGVDPTDLYGVDPTIDTPADAADLIRVSKEYVDDCTIKFGDVLPFVSTRDVAQDMDTVRAAMGDEQLSYLGFSYGTAIGQVYADLFPTGSAPWCSTESSSSGPPGLELAAEQAAGFETALARYVEFCNAAEGCETAGNALGAVEEVLAAGRAAGRHPGADEPTVQPDRVRPTLGISLGPLLRDRCGPDLDAALAAALGRRRRPSSSPWPTSTSTRRLRDLLRGELHGLRVARRRPRRRSWRPPSRSARARPTSVRRSSTTTSAAPTGQCLPTRCSPPPRQVHRRSWS